MWPRYCELLLALWLIISHFLLGYDGNADFLSAILLASFALASFRFPRAHLFSSSSIYILLFTAYTYPTYELPFSLQNLIITALTIALFVILPCGINDSPHSKAK